MQNKSEAIEFINDYEDCVKNIKTINKTKYKIVFTKEWIGITLPLRSENWMKI